MKKFSLVLSVGFALFSMFFGSGNLVFPLLVGKGSGDHFLLASLGIFLTGILMPFLGILAIMLCKGKTDEFFGSLGKYAPFWLSLLSLSLMGPFGVIPRCITVAYGSFRLLYSEFPLVLFSAIFCALTFVAAVRKDKLVSILGYLLTPLLLGALAMIALFGYWTSPGAQPVTTGWNAFETGFLQGYQTMDLLAAFFFSAFVIGHLEQSATSLPGESPMRVFFKSSLVGAGLLAIVYFSLVWLGASYAQTLDGVAPQEMLGTISQAALGSYSAPIVCAAVVLACFTTAVVLALLFADFFREKIAKGRISRGASCALTLLVSLCVSTLEFSGIAAFLAPILETIYPALIMLTLINIGMGLLGMKRRRWPIVLVLLAKLGFA